VLASFLIDPLVAHSLWRKALATSERIAEQAALTSDALYDAASKPLRAARSSLARLTNSGSACAPSAGAGKPTNAISAAGTPSRTPGVAVAKLKQAQLQAKGSNLTAKPIRALRRAATRGRI
jgi:hypothetical protein